MEEKRAYLPLGSVIGLKGGVRKYMIVARGLQVNVKGKTKYFDYGACLYPEGMMGDQLMYFQKENIRKEYFCGFSDEDDKVMVENIVKAVESQEVDRADVDSLKKEMEKG